MPTISEPLKLPCGVTLPSRIAKSATSEGLADVSGCVTPALERLYAGWAGAGLGLIITGNIMVDRRHLERPGNIVIDGETTAAQIAGLRSWASASRRGGAHVWAQLSHAGRRTHKSVNSHPLSASAIKLAAAGDPFGQPDEILGGEIEWAVTKYAAAARVCKDAGFTGVQILAGQKHLISSFLDPNSNHRRDNWGGSPENRMVLLLAIVNAVRGSVGAEFPIGVKLDVNDFPARKEGLVECEQVIAALEAVGVDLVELSGGRHRRPALIGEAGISAKEASFLELGFKLGQRLKMPLMLTGGVRTLAVAQSVLNDGFAMVGVARPLCVDPHAVKKLLAGDVDELVSSERNDQSRFFGRVKPITRGYWFCAQLYRLSRGEVADRDLDPTQARREVVAVEQGILGGTSPTASVDSAAKTSGPIMVESKSDSAHGNLLGGAATFAWRSFKTGLMTVWYLHAGMLTRLRPTIEIEGKKLVILPGVYKPLENEAACADYCRAGDRVLDLGSGSGVCSIFCAPIAREVVAVDISAAAVRNTEENCRRLGVSNVTAFQSDMFARVEGRFDLILANAPYVATDFESEEAQFATSVRYLPTLFAEANRHLTDDGRLLVQFPIWFRKRIERLANQHGLQVITVRRMPRKSFGLTLLSVAYLQVGFRSAYFLIQPRRVARTKLAA